MMKKLSKHIRDKKFLVDYKCDWCSNKFSLFIGKYEGHGDHQSVSTQVKCNKCQNFIPTYDEKVKKNVQ